MTYVLDPDIGAALAAIFPPDEPPALPEAGDWQSLREMTNGSMAWMNTLIPAFPEGYPGVEVADKEARAEDGAGVRLRWYARSTTASGDSAGATGSSAVVFVHGGGMVAGSMDLYDPVMAGYVEATGVPFLAVDYRVAPEATGATAARDMFAGLSWLHEHADELGVDPERIALMGDSAGGGIAAGTAILAREKGIPVAKQLLIYPMLDDRNVAPNELLAPFLTWRPEDNITGWGALLGEQANGAEVDPVAAPARLRDYAGLPPTYLEVGELDLFREEDLDYAQQLMRAGVPLELHVRPGANHGFERLAPDSTLARRAMQDRYLAVTAI